MGLFRAAPPPLTRPPNYFAEFRVTASPSDVRIDLFTPRADSTTSCLRVFMSHLFSRRLLSALETSIDVHERAYGKVRVTRRGDSPPAEASTLSAVSEVVVNYVEVSTTEADVLLDFRSYLVRKGRPTETFLRVLAVTSVGQLPHLHSTLREVVESLPRW